MNNLKWAMRKRTEKELREDHSNYHNILNDNVKSKYFGQADYRAYNKADSLFHNEIDRKSGVRTLAMAEMEGILPTRFGNLNAAIKDIKDYPSPSIDMDTFENILNYHGLSFNDLSPREKRYIDEAIR